MAAQPRLATLADLPAIEELERACFQDYRRASPDSLRRSLTSPKQSVWVVDRAPSPSSPPSPRPVASAVPPAPPRLSGLLVLWHFPHRLRVYDIATDPAARGQGLGGMLLAHAESLAHAAGCSWLTLEAEEADQRLVAWYQRHGFAAVDRLADFYHEGCHAVRMTKRLG
ncbi:MAG TPA: N-acetyltransferase [Candidatus Thermoplasmatota archaeon]|nr:N-acetyltransferase [Candidatus Thermoplasmatota archaeon]